MIWLWLSLLGDRFDLVEWRVDELNHVLELVVRVLILLSSEGVEVPLLVISLELFELGLHGGVDLTVIIISVIRSVALGADHNCVDEVILLSWRYLAAVDADFFVVVLGVRDLLLIIWVSYLLISFFLLLILFFLLSCSRFSQSIDLILDQKVKSFGRVEGVPDGVLEPFVSCILRWLEVGFGDQQPFGLSICHQREDITAELDAWSWLRIGQALVDDICGKSISDFVGCSCILLDIEPSRDLGLLFGFWWHKVKSLRY